MAETRPVGKVPLIQTMPIPFCKFHGFGNDYIVIERKAIPDELGLDQLAIDICNRNTGAGADGIAVLERLDDPQADYYCEIVNPDGSFAGFSGNGTRCAVAYLNYKNLWSAADFRLRTRSGVKLFHLIERNGDEFRFEAEIGKPRFASEEIPVLIETRRDHVINEPIEVDGRHYAFSAINVGNPVACIFVDNFNFDWRGAARAMEKHEGFPERTNVVFIRLENRDEIEIRIWERGAGETSASGSCSSGAAILSAFLLKTQRKVLVRSEGGTTEILWRDDDEIVITGPAVYVYCGEWP
ncbi:MAG: diaminopimelate epimerase [Pyrinomonadaceae bacterium]